MLEVMLSFHNRRRALLLPIYFVIVTVPLFAWGQDSPSREQGIRPLHVQKNTERFSNGMPKAEYCFYRGKDGREVLHGKYISWLESGQEFSVQNYRNGKAEGRTVYWHENGKKSRQGMYHDGSPVGTWASWHKNGQKEFSLSQVDEIFASLPASVWVEGKSIGVQQLGLASEADHQTMDQVTQKLTAFFAGKGYRVRRLPQ